MTDIIYIAFILGDRGIAERYVLIQSRTGREERDEAAFMLEYPHAKSRFSSARIRNV